MQACMAWWATHQRTVLLCRRPLPLLMGMTGPCTRVATQTEGAAARSTHALFEGRMECACFGFIHECAPLDYFKCECV